LRSCYESSLRLAAGARVATIAFPCISTGSYGYPKGEACDIAVSAVSEWLRSAELPRSVVFCCLTSDSAELYRRRLEALA
jgi:O-acetyl-ADP-ribose deacetylase (regulator of RNase III)